MEKNCPFVIRAFDILVNNFYQSKAKIMSFKSAFFLEEEI